MNYTDVSLDTQKIFNQLIDDASLERVVNIKFLGCPELKQIGKVVKANDLLKFMTDNDVIILINEDWMILSGSVRLVLDSKFP